jgi:hypothetical protein
MKRRSKRLATVIALALLLSSIAFAGTGSSAVLRWQDVIDQSRDYAEQSPIAARLLADGTLVVAMATPGLHQLSVAVFPPGSSVASVVPVYLPTGRDRVAFDACGDLFVAATRTFEDIATPNEGDLWLMKFDHVTGHPLWNEPFVWNGPGNVGDLVADVIADESGDAILTAFSSDAYTSLKIGGVDGSLLWTSPSILNGRNQRAFSAIDSQGDVYFAAERQAPTVGTRVGAWALARDTGTLVWGPVDFQMVPGDSGDEEPRGVAVDPAGHLLIVADAAGQMALLRLVGGSGAVIWGPTSLGPGNANGLAVGAGGNLFVSGTRPQNPDPERILISRDLTSGAPLWGPIAFPLATTNAPTLIPTGNGDLLMTAIVGNQTVGRRLLSARIGRDGALVWEEYRDAMSNRTSLSFLDHDASLIELFVPSQVFSTGPPQIARRDAASGVTSLPPQPFSGVINDAYQLPSAGVTPDGNIVTVSMNTVFPSTSTRVRKLDRVDGHEIWTRILDGGSPRVAVDASGDILSTTWTLLTKLDGDTGATIWVTLTGANTLPRYLAFDAAGDAIIASVSNSIPSSTLLEKRSGVTGALLWGPVTYGPAGNNSPVGVSLSAGGDIFLSVRGPGSSSTDWVTLKYAGSTGNLLWGPIFFDQSGGSDFPGGIATLPGGDVVVVGNSVGTLDEIAAIRYSTLNGSVVWGPVFLASGDGRDTGMTSIAVDPAGNVFVTGYAFDPQDTNSVDILAAKVLGANGSISWGPVLHDTGVNDYGISIALLSSGDPVALGFRDRYQVPGEKTLLLFSWESSTGNLRWGPIEHVNLLDEFPHWVGVGANTIYVVADALLNGSRPQNATTPTTLILAYVETLGIATPPGDFLTTCGEPISVALGAVNATGATTWTLTSGSLPDGLTLSSAGLLSGTPSEIGRSTITIQVQDSSLATATRELTIVVREQEMVSIVATPVDDCTWMLSVPGGWTSYAWEPGGETTSTITVSPLNDTIYGVTVGDGSGCTVRGSILIRATRLIDPDCDAPGLTSISPTSGPASGGTDVTLTGSGFEAGSEARIGGVPASTTFQDPTTLVATTDAMDPGTLNHALVTNPDLGTAILFDAFFADFLDVDQLHPFHDFVEALVRGGVTAGCGAGNYCPDDAATREQMAVFLLRSKEGPSYTPPACVMPTFSDVPCSSPFAPWIEELVDRQVTSGCGFGNYCPADAATREQMAVFLLRTLEGPSYTPPACVTPSFSDVPCSSGFARWIEELVLRNITAGCGGGMYCPLQAVTRGQMAVFLTVTFSLP